MAARISEPGYRPTDSHGYSGPGRDLPREPPRGPKALLDGPRGGGLYPRGRGFAGRGEVRDRDYRDARDAPGLGRGRERDWGPRDAFDNRERRPSPSGRNRSRSPVPRDPRDPRDILSRDIDQSRVRRGSRDRPPSAGSSISDVQPSTYRGRGGYRGRVRGDRDYNRRGRGGFHEEREGFRLRSRSRDRAWDRNRDRDQEMIRRDEDTRKDWETRERDSDRYGKDQPPYRSESRNPTSTQISPLTPHPPSTVSSYQVNVERFARNSRAFSAESHRRTSEVIGDADSLTVSRDIERADPAHTRPSRDRPGPGTVSPPPQAPQVPAFGSIAYRTSSTDQNLAANRNEMKSEVQPVYGSQNASKDLLTGPKVEILANAPTGPKAEQKVERSPIADSVGLGRRVFDNERASYGAANSTATTLSPAPAAIDSQNQSIVAPAARQSREVSTAHVNRRVGPSSESQHALDSGTAQSIHAFGSKVVEGDDRPSNTSSNLSPTTTIKQTLQESQNQASLTKIPTGPRAERSNPSSRQIAAPPIRVSPLKPTNAPPRPPRNSNWKWIRPGLGQHTPRGPSIMNTVPTKRDFNSEDRSRGAPGDSESRGAEGPEWSRAKIHVRDGQVDQKMRQNSETGRAMSDLNIQEDESRYSTEARNDIDEVFQRLSGSAQPSEVRKSPESDDVGMEEGVMELDEADILEAEQKFEQQVQALELKRPATPRHHPLLLQLLEECDALASAAEEIAKKPTDEREASSSIGTLQLGLPSPKLEEPEKMHVEEELLFPILPAKTRRQTPPVESLPFLMSGLPTPFSEMEELQEQLDQHELIKARLVEDILSQQQRVEAENNEIKNEFAAGYRRWRIEIETAEMPGRSNAATSEPNSPILASNTSTSTVLGRRTGKNTSQLDYEAVLKESLTVHQKDEERRNREKTLQSKDFFNPDKEADVPDMLDRFERKARFFNDTNNLIDSELVLDTLGFIPKQDDFTPEEHEAFLDTYLSNPKKWGVIADALFGRDFQDCVLHYYHTKGEALYKEKEKAYARIAKKGRKGGRGLQDRPKSNALMPLYDGAIDYDTPQIPVTDTGRPKRAAAPTFGDTTDAELPTAAATPSRRITTGNKGDANGDSSERPSTKRTRTAPAKEKGAKKGKVAVLAAAPGPSPQKADKELARGQSKEPKLESEQRSEEIEGAQLLAGLHTSQTVNLPASQLLSNSNETWLAVQPAPTSTPIPTLKQQQTILEQPQQQQQPRGSTTTTSSYWSVPEQTDFQNLIHHFGTDWQAIASAMKTKTPTMVYICLFESSPMYERHGANIFPYRSRIIISVLWSGINLTLLRKLQILQIKEFEMERTWVLHQHRL